MAHIVSDQMVEDYRRLGYVILRRIIPTALIMDLRAATARAAELARRERGANAQRLQPVRRYADQIALAPFLDYMTLPPLVDALAKILTPRHRLSNGNLDRLGLFVEPSGHAWASRWHRDFHMGTPHITDTQEFRRLALDPLFFTQVNCPLYEDNCTWYVPSSALRVEDMPEETAAAAAPIREDDQMDDAERERRLLDYFQGMPGAQRMFLEPGDFMLWHPLGWHGGRYVPSLRRTTIHDWVPTPELLEWYHRVCPFMFAAPTHRAATPSPANPTVRSPEPTVVQRDDSEHTRQDHPAQSAV